MSTLGELLDGVRAFYLDRFREQIEECEADLAQQVIAEPVLLSEQGEPVREGAFQLAVRVDLVVLRDGECIDQLVVDTPQMLSFDPVDFTWEGSLRVQLGPFQWNMCPLALAPAPSLEQLPALTKWFERWFEESDGAEPPFAHCVHYLSDPEEEEGECRLALDLGSAPTAAFEELLDACRSAGATSVRIGEARDASRSEAPERRPRPSRRRNPRRR